MTIHSGVGLQSEAKTVERSPSHSEENVHNGHKPHSSNELERVSSNAL